MRRFQNAEVNVEIVITDGLDELLPNDIRVNGNTGNTGLLAHIDEIGPSFGEIKLGYERDRLCYLCTDGLFIWVGKGNHCRYKLWLEGLLVGERDRVLVLESLSETVHQNKFDLHHLAIQVLLYF
jgi:hypothetical protein